MKIKGRTEKSMLNVLTGVFGQALSFVLSFAIRTVFIQTLGELYLGLNGLYTNILSVLNLTELGLGTAIVIELYRTVENKDEEKTLQYLQLYKKAYNLIGAVILVIGLAITPFLNHFIKDEASLGLINYRLVFILYLLNTSFSYFSFAYRESILQANQAEYKARVITYLRKFLEMVLQIIFLFCFKNIYIYLIIPLVLGCVSVVVKGILIGKWYPFIKNKPKGKLSKEELRTTFRNIFSVALYKVSNTVIGSTDNIILSSYISIIITGLYSNYLILVSAVNTILEKVFSAFTASLGSLNVAAGNDLNRKYSVFSTLSFLNFWFYGFCSVCFMVLFQPFIKVWIGERFIMNDLTEIVIVLNFLITGLQETVRTHRAAYGLFYRGRYRPIFSVVINIVSSILFVKLLPEEYGVVAVLLGTILSNLSVSWWYDAYIVHKYAFQRSPLHFYLTFWLRVAYVSAFCFGLKYLCSFISISPVMDVIVHGLICAVIYNAIFIILFRKTDEFQHIRSSLMRIIKKPRKNAREGFAADDD